MSPFCPPPGFPPHLVLFWPLVWAQVLVARAWVRASYGKGTLYRWSVTPHGRVVILSIDHVPGQGAEPEGRAAIGQRAVRAHARIVAATNLDLAYDGADEPTPRARNVRTRPVSIRSLSGLFTASASLPLPDT